MIFIAAIACFTGAGRLNITIFACFDTCESKKKSLKRPFFKQDQPVDAGDQIPMIVALAVPPPAPV